MLTAKSIIILENLATMSDATREKFIAGLDDDERGFLLRILEKTLEGGDDDWLKSKTAQEIAE